MERIINMTPHVVNIVNVDGKEIARFESTGQIRLSSRTIPVGRVAGVSLTKTIFGEPEGLPDFSEGTFYIVSQIVKSALPDRTDLLVPAEVVRDDSGRIIGCRSLGI